MPDSVPKLSFTGGEIAPNLYDRTDLAKHGAAVRRMENMFVHPQGAVSNRAGFQFVNATLNSDKRSKLFKFQFNVEQAYALEFGDKYIRVYKDRALVTDGPTGGINLVDDGSYQWTGVAGTLGTEYYLQLVAGGDAGLAEPERVYEAVGTRDRTMVSGTVDSLVTGEWGWGQIGGVPAWGNAIWTRLSDDVDPDTKEDGFLEAAYVQEAGFGTSIVDPLLYKWTQTPAFPTVIFEYFMEPITPGAPSFLQPEALYENGNPMNLGSGVGALNQGEWLYSAGFGSLSGSISVRLSDDADPSTKADGFVEAAYIQPPGEAKPIVSVEVYQWTQTADGGAPGEYYLEAFGGGFPGITGQIPRNMWEDAGNTDVLLTAVIPGNVGSLNAGEWTVGANGADGLAVPTIYVRLTDDSDPDSHDEGYVTIGFIEQVETPYREVDLAEIQISQSADILYITHPSYPRMKLTRRDHDVWILTAVRSEAGIEAPGDLEVSVAIGTVPANYVVTAVSTTGEESIASNSVLGNRGSTFTWAPVADVDHYNFYKDENESLFYGWIGSAGSETFHEPEAGITADFAKSPPEERTPFDEINDYPGVSAFHEQRLVYARTNNAPQSIFGSVIGNPDNFNVSVPIQDSDAYTFTLNSNQVNEIAWIVSMNGLVIGTTGAEWLMQPGGNTNAITPSSVFVQPLTRWGSARIPPEVIGDTLVFLNRKKNLIRDLQFSTEADGYKGNDVTVMAHHLFKDHTIVDWAYQPIDNSILWCVRSDGKLLGLTYFKEHEVFGWHIHETDGFFESVVSVETGDGTSDLYVIVKRTIEGTTKRYVEVLRDRIPLRDDGIRDVQDSFFVDSGLTLDVPLTITAINQSDPMKFGITAHGLSAGDFIDVVEVEGMTEINDKRFKVINPNTNDFEVTDLNDVNIDATGFTTYTTGGKARQAVTSISGLDHLEGKAIAVLANGNVIPGKVVASGEFTLTEPASRVHAGLAYTSELETLDFITTTRGATSQDRVKDITTAVVGLEDTRALSIGPDVSNLTTEPFKFTEDYGEAIGLFTGSKEVLIDPGELREARLVVQHTDPVPITITSLIARMDVGQA